MSNRCPNKKQVADIQRRLARRAWWMGLSKAEKALLITRKATPKDIRRARANAAEIAREAA